VTAPLTLHAKWKVAYRVTFAPQNGEDPAAETVGNGTTPSIPPTPTRAGYRFLGWFTAPTGGRLYDPTLPVTEELTLYAQWEVYSAEEELASPGANAAGLLWTAASLVAVGAALMARAGRRLAARVI